MAVSFLLTTPAARAQEVPPALVPLVQPKPGNRPLGEVLAELSRQSRLPFSYSSSLVPTARRYAVRPGPPRPLATVLREMLAAEQLSFGLVGGQLVLWPSRAGIPAGVVAVNGQPAPVVPAADRVVKPSASAPPAALATASAPAAASLASSGSYVATLSAKTAGSKTAEKARVKPAMALERPGSDERGIGSKELIGKAPGNAAPASQTSRKPGIGSKPAPAIATKTTSGIAATTASVAAADAKNRGINARKLASKAAKSTVPAKPLAAVNHSRRSVIQPQKASSMQASTVSTSGAPLRMRTPRAASASVATSGQKSRNNLPRRSPDNRAVASESPISVAQSGKQAALLPAKPFRSEMPLLAPITTQPPASGLEKSLPAIIPTTSASAPTLAADAQAATSTNSPPKQRTSLATLAGDKYLHGEAAFGETLVLSGVAKAGFQRIYLVVGAGVVGGGRQGGGGFGIGLGTAGQARGRFTPSLDVLGWFLNGSREAGLDHSQLVQLRPTLAWQIKQGSRWQLIGGPTFNLATSHNEGNAIDRWQLGHDQWLWLDSSDEHGNVRLWPGVQLGVRF